MKKLTVIAAGLLITASLSAQELVGVIFPSSWTERDPASLAVAGADYASLGSTAYASFRNPAVLGLADYKFQAGASWSNWNKDLNLAAGASVKLGKFIGLSLGYMRQGSLTPEISSASGESFIPADHLINLGLGFKVAPFLGFGVNAHYTMQKLDVDVTSGTFYADVYAQGLVGPVAFTAGVTGIGKGLESLSGVKFPLPTMAKLSVVGTLPLGFEAMLGGELGFNGGLAASVGARYTFKDIVSVSAGYRYANARSVSPSYFSAGIGAKISVVRINVTYMTGQAAPVKNIISAGLAVCL